jgi:energy-coupling factor transporter ATP-binding protein EcfA2
MVLKFGQRFPQALSQINRCNVLVIGNTGIGKSTLISALFQVTISNSVTAKISEKPYTKASLPIAVYDASGLETDKNKRDNQKQVIADFINEKNQNETINKTINNFIKGKKQKETKEPEDQIHAVWYCVHSHTVRQSQIEQQWIASIAKDLPVIAVITRASGIEKDWLHPYLESIPTIQRVVPIMARRETTHHYDIKPYGLDALLAATEDMLEQIAQKAILNAVNARANLAFGWCRDGCTKVLASQFLPIPIPGLKTLAISGIQLWMLVDISKTFGYQFDRAALTELCTVGVGSFGSFVGVESFIEEALQNLPGIDYNNIQTVKDVLLHLKTMLDHAAGTFPFKEQLMDLLSGLADSNLISDLPILSCLTAITTTLATGFMAVAYIETMKTLKKAEYEGQPMPDLKAVFDKQIQQLMEFLNQVCREGWSSGFVN